MRKLITGFWMTMGVFYAMYFWVNVREMILHPFEMLAHGLVGALLVMLLLREVQYEVAEEGEAEEEEGKDG